MTPDIPVDGGTPDTITYPHPHRDPACGTRIPTGLYGIHQECRRPAAHDGPCQPYRDACPCPAHPQPPTP